MAAWSRRNSQAEAPTWVTPWNTALMAKTASRQAPYREAETTASAPSARRTRNGNAAMARPPPTMWLMALNGSLRGNGAAKRPRRFRVTASGVGLGEEHARVGGPLLAEAGEVL